MAFAKAVLATAALLVMLDAPAAPVTFAFTGALDQLPLLDPDSPFPDPVDDTTTFSGTFTFDRNAVNGVVGDPQTGAYESVGAPYGFTLSIGGLTFSSTDVTITTANNYFGLGDQYGVFYAAPSNCGKFACPYFSLSLIDPTATALGSNALPLSPSFGAFLYSTFFYQDQVGDDQIQLDGVLTSLVCTAGCTVPEPATPLMFGIGLIALACGRKLLSSRGS